MTHRRLWPDGLSGRVAVILMIALIIEFVGGELIFRRFEAERAGRDSTAEIAEHLRVAERLILPLPPAERQQQLDRGWTGSLKLTWTAEQPATPAGAPHSLEGAVATAEVLARELQFYRDGPALLGRMHLADDTWLSFRADEYADPRPNFRNQAAALLLLVACLAIAALLVMRMLGGPLRRLASAADKVGRDEPVTIPPEGPREVRQVAVAFNAMQTRLMDVVNDRMQALAAVSHDLRTPIARMRLRMAGLRSGKTRDGIEHDLNEMEAFITSVVDYLRGEDFEPERLVDIASIILTIVDDAQDMGGDITYAGPHRFEAVTRPVKLQRAIANIVQNAVKHAGPARVFLHPEHNGFSVVVEDDGPGIPPDMLEAVFTPFRRLESPRGRLTGGLGLGLSAVRRSMATLGGEVVLENREEGGLRATLRLPLKTPGTP